MENDNLKNILIKMCEYTNIYYDGFDFKQPYWFLKHSWSESQQNDFTEWLANYLKIKNNRIGICKENISIKDLEKVVKDFVFQYGWKIDKMR